MYPMTDEEFEAAIQEALDAMPEQFLAALENVAVTWEDEPSEYHLNGLGAEGWNEGDGEGTWGDDANRYGDASWEDDADWDGEGEWQNAETWRGEESQEANGDALAADDMGAAEDADTAEGDDDYMPGPNDLLGLFDGISIVERADGYDDDIPNVITVFKGPHERCFKSREEVVAEIGKTVVHELGHYFGLDDDRLYDMGY